MAFSLASLRPECRLRWGTAAVNDCAAVEINTIIPGTPNVWTRWRPTSYCSHSRCQRCAPDLER